MKKILAVILLLTVLTASAASAESLVGSDYIDVPAVMTQDSVVELLTDDESRLIEALEPDEPSVFLLNDVYDFVWEKENRPARYYDLPTQEKISELVGSENIDFLHMTEAMRLQMTGAPEEDETDVRAIMRLDVEYEVGQLIVVVLGIRQETGEYQWFPYRGRVDVLGEIKWDMPAEDWGQFVLQPVSFHVLTDRIGPRGGRLWGAEYYSDKTPPSFSKDSDDIVKMKEWYSEWGEVIEDPFSVWLVALTGEMNEEVIRIGKYLSEEKPILDYFPVERKEEALLLLPEDVDYTTLIAYDIVALKDKDYNETYGDVNVEIIFGTVYDPGKAMVALAGFPIENAVEAPFVEWYVLRATALYDEKTGIDSVEIGLKQLFLPDMEIDPLMMIVLSEPLEEEIAEN